uniref:Uncharacterized protein n=1 Tax=Arundo donax TaxID=35708 RepID=A0A0A8Z2C9_ARUDO
MNLLITSVVLLTATKEKTIMRTFRLRTKNPI